MINQSTLSAIRADLDKAFALVAKTHGLSNLKLGKITYDDKGSFWGKIEGTESGGLSREAQYYNDLRRSMPSLPPLGSKVKVSGREIEIVGSNTTGSKIVGIDNGKKFLYRAMDIARIAQFGKVSASIGADKILAAGGNP